MTNEADAFGGPTVRGTALETVPAFGSGFTTVTIAVLAEGISEGRMAAVNCDGLA
jgi:hypothetical protein